MVICSYCIRSNVGELVRYEKEEKDVRSLYSVLYGTRARSLHEIISFTASALYASVELLMHAYAYSYILHTHTQQTKPIKKSATKSRQAAVASPAQYSPDDDDDDDDDDEKREIRNYLRIFHSPWRSSYPRRAII